MVYNLFWLSVFIGVIIVVLCMIGHRAEIKLISKNKQTESSTPSFGPYRTAGAINMDSEQLNLIESLKLKKWKYFPDNDCQYEHFKLGRLEKLRLERGKLYVKMGIFKSFERLPISAEEYDELYNHLKWCASFEASKKEEKLREKVTLKVQSLR